MTVDERVPIADAVLYEGYALYPYRASSPKNRVRFPFGGVYPPAYASAQRGSDHSSLRSECLVRVEPGARVRVCLRCLTLGPPAAGAAPGAWQEAVEQKLDWQGALEPGETTEPFRLADIPGVLRVIRRSVSPGVVKLGVGVENRSGLAVLEREAALAGTLLSVNLVLRVDGGAFVSRLDPPADLCEASARCESEGLHPVLLGRAGDAHSMLLSPIILYDYPEVAAKSPGDLFDATEIDEILSLRIQTLTATEKAEMHALEPRLARLLERTEGLGSNELADLHGALGPSRKPNAPFEPGEKVRICPKRRADIFDLALAGRVATVRSVECDAEDTVYLCVTVDDDPGADLGIAGQPGHRFFFTPEELEPYTETAGGP